MGWRKSSLRNASAVVILAALAGSINRSGQTQEKSAEPKPDASSQRDNLHQFVAQYCADCHNEAEKAGGLDLDAISKDDTPKHTKSWEAVVRKLAARQMPPLDAERPSDSQYSSIVADLETQLDQAAAAKPNPGRTDTFRRLNRTEYQNAIRDLLALDIDAADLLPSDDASHGFDNVALGNLSPTLMDRYLTAAQKLSRLAVGQPQRSPGGDTFRVRPDLTQEEHVEGLPLGTRGGTLISYTFPQDGQYEVRIWLTRDRNEEVEGLTEPHKLQVLLDRSSAAEFTVSPPSNHDQQKMVDAKLTARIAVTAGPHELGVTFLKNPSSLLETKRQPYQAHYNMHRHPRISPAIYQVSLTGPYDSKGHGDTPSRRRIFISQPTSADDEEDCAKGILTAIVRRAYRRVVADDDLAGPMKFYREGRAEGDFDAGIELALTSVLINPQFLFRIEREPAGVAANTAYPIDDFSLASRLSFFIWSTIPDDELLDLAERHELGKPEVLKAQVRRLLADRRSQNLTTNFAAQWLYLRNLDAITPDLRLFPDFDDNLRQAFRKETELCFESVVREDRSVLNLLKSDYTFVNERLAKHYGIPNVYGERFRRISLDEGSERGGLLRQGSILTVTSYATRTSPVIRGKWILENLLGSPPPRPPASVPPLKDNTLSSMLSVRDRLSEHRSNAACATCHKLIDPVGFSLEEFDAVGRWRDREDGKPIDAAGSLPDGSEFSGAAGLERALLKHPEIFVRTLTEKLFTFALGRAPEYFDAPTIRSIVRDARANDYRVSSLLVGIATSTPFRMRTSE
jgi:mono/diheme cytochrome c family protein